MEVAPSVDILEILGVGIVIPSMNMEFEDVQDLPKVQLSDCPALVIVVPSRNLTGCVPFGPPKRSYPPIQPET
jgi:hypothetical protein